MTAGHVIMAGSILLAVRRGRYDDWYLICATFRGCGSVFASTHFVLDPGRNRVL